ncbi:MAG TPA: FAD-dependent thymidylate synthase [Longimicrobium sp.]|jgi:thymidylate synthase (FAD)|nr:FAD-dependent thymidylate synthase [Longimicrobium sp.]
MQIIRQPRVTVVARQQFTVPPHINWKSDSEVAGEALAEFAGRNCYLSFGADAGLEGGHKSIPGRTTNREYLSNILKTKHGSVLEHAVWSLYLEGISRSLTHELVRHRAGFGFSQLSQRYVDESDIGFVLPPEIEDGTPSFEVWAETCRATLEGYRRLLSATTEQVGDSGPVTMRKKRARQAARSVLPNCAETKIVVTGNARAWRHFCEMRGASNADVEIRRLAIECLRQLHAEAAHLFGDMRIVDADDGTQVIETEHSKV